MNEPELLLRDIHLPAPVSWWPPAPGWWLVVIAIASLVLFAMWWRRRIVHLRNAPAALAQRELAKLQDAWVQHGDTQQLQRALSIWLRRTSMSLTSRAQAASLTGAQWQQFLTQLPGEKIFSDTELQLITRANYQPAQTAATPADGDRLLANCQHWLEASTRRVSGK